MSAIGRIGLQPSARKSRPQANLRVDHERIGAAVPDVDDRARALGITERVMGRPRVPQVRNILWRKLMFKDYLSRHEIERIAASVTTTPDADLLAGERRPEVAASVGVRPPAHAAKKAISCTGPSDVPFPF